MEDKTHGREHPRVERILLTAVEQYNVTGELAEARIGRTLNISEGGILLEVDQPLPFLAKVSLSVALREDIIRVEGEVSHLRRTKDGKIEMGIKFLNLSEKNLQVIQKHLSA